MICPSHICRIRVTSPSSQSHSKFIRVESDSSHRNCRVNSCHWSASSSQRKFTIFPMPFCNVMTKNFVLLGYSIVLMTWTISPLANW